MALLGIILRIVAVRIWPQETISLFVLYWVATVRPIRLHSIVPFHNHVADF